MSVLIHNCTALLMDEENTVLKDAFVAVAGASILSVGAQRPAGSFDQELDAGGQVLMPGLVNAHTHVPMTLLRGYGGGCDLHTWLTKFIFPAEDRLDGRAVRAGALLGLAELISSGVTTIADMYMFCNEIARAAADAGINANIARGATLFVPEFDFHTHPACVEMRELAEQWHGHNGGQILIDACLHGEYTSRPAVWEAVAGYAKDKGLGMHVHISETRSEHEECISRHGLTPIQALDKYGVWDVRAIAAHCVWVTPEDMALMAAKGVSAIHNPVSNLKLGSGVAPVPALMKAGVNVALGTDGVSSNNSHDMFEDLKVAAILHNGVTCDPLALLPQDALRMATVNGAKALGRKTGQIRPGYDADLILLDFNRPSLTPCHSVADNLAYSARGGDVTMNMARGKVIYRNGDFLTIDLAAVMDEVHRYALPKIFG
ncbi:5-methylthioadenosine/S-adenosylhomocysteine deaminase [bioreactor metagenome]|uniref:5-methylthioadenosine/S-adenosylhomocysteine deaminase n=1 Tax=bioreactor metagenome TaxID=1076179 RepID=A0A644XLK1_9ZZZZ